MDYLQYKKLVNDNELYHYNIKGSKWGVRRYQNPDGTLTEAGKERYRKYKETSKSEDEILDKFNEQLKKDYKHELETSGNQKRVIDATGNLAKSTLNVVPSGGSKRVYKNYSELSDKEIDDQIRRIEREHRLSDLTENTKYVQSGRDKAREIIQSVAGGLAIASSAAALALAIKQLRGPGKMKTIKNSDEYSDCLYHYGILGMKWGRRRYQTENGKLTAAGKQRYRTTQGTVEKLENSPKYDNLVKPEAREYMKYRKREGAVKGAIAGAVAGSIIHPLSSLKIKTTEFTDLNGNTRVSLNTPPKKIVNRFIRKAITGAITGAAIGGLIGKASGKRKAERTLATNGRKYTEQLLKTPIKQIKKEEK